MMAKKINVMLVVAISLSSCSTTYKANKKIISADTSKVYDAFSKSNNSIFGKSYKMVKDYSDGVYIGLKPFKVKQGEALPVNVEADGVKLYSSQKLGLEGIAKLITTSTHIPVNISRNKDSNKNGGDASDNTMYEKLNAVINASVSPVQQLDMYDGLPGMTVDYSGKLSNFLKLVSSYFGVSWQYMNGIIFLSNYEVRTFSINTLPGKVSSKAKMDIGLSAGGAGGSDGSGGSGSSGSAGGGGDSSSGGTTDTLSSTNSSESSVNLDLWSDIKKNLAILIQGNGSFSVSEGLSSITVSTTPGNMMNIQKYIDQLNINLQQEVSVNVTMYNLTLNDDSSWNYSLTAMFSALKGKISGNMAFFPGDSTGGGMQGTTENGSSFILNMLDSQGKVDVINSANVTTMSGQPVPLQVSNTRGYVSSIGTTMNDNTSQSSLNVSLIDSGYALNVLPRVLDNGKILLQYSISMSSLVGKNNGFDEFAVDKQKIQLPDVNQHSFVQQNILNNNQTLLVAGYKNSENHISDSGVGDPGFKLLGGSRGGKDKKEIVVISITPTALNLGDN
ncbi:secretin N-terminal domain-containing protein [Yokenella regensburgei]|uniref:secretin N-terminal domain-containing protein n=1 Tax=Yokenella regensburgei TaxID=158877 RepID=UPI003EDAB227